MANVIPNSNEIIMNDNDFIVSKTDTKGYITYCNRIFIEMAKYKESALIGANHNIIRHPFMPKVAFKLAWDLIQSKKEFFGFVKNLSADGSFYWVFAHITPDYNRAGNIVGYTSVRRKPPRSAIPTVEGLYQQLNQQEQQGGMQVAADFLFKFLDDNNVTYDELVLSLFKG